MKAVISIKIDLLEPAHVVTALNILELHPSQIREMSVRVACPGLVSRPSVEAVVPNTTDAMHDLISIVQNSQPEGTFIEVWFHGRYETIRI